MSCPRESVTQIRSFILWKNCRYTYSVEFKQVMRPPLQHAAYKREQHIFGNLRYLITCMHMCKLLFYTIIWAPISTCVSINLGSTHLRSGITRVLVAKPPYCRKGGINCCAAASSFIVVRDACQQIDRIITCVVQQVALTMTSLLLSLRNPLYVYVYSRADDSCKIMPIVAKVNKTYCNDDFGITENCKRF